MPDGEDLERLLKQFFRAQLADLLGRIPPVFAEIPSDFARLDNYDNRMAQAMTPILTAYWDEAGQSLRERIGLDPESWQVTDPNLKQAIQEQAFNFCSSTNASTTDTLETAHRRIRDALTDGVLTQGEAIPALTKRIKSVYKGLSDKHANLIAVTETSRAVHAASLRSAKESGVVTGKKWLLSSNACPTCQKIANEANTDGIGVDSSFATIGSNPTYSNITMPPAHPRCRCTVTFVVDEEYLRSLGVDPSEINGEVAAVEPIGAMA